MEQDTVNIDRIAKLIFPDCLPTVAELFDLYPKRVLPEKAMVTRFAPSPTGFMHLGGVYMALISDRFAHQSNGVCYLRLEDTDRKRHIASADEIIIKALDYFGLPPDEGPSQHGSGIGNYGPYRQSARGHIYKAFLKQMLLDRKIYPCFCSEIILDDVKKIQATMEVRPGYHGVWAKCRNLDFDTIEKNLLEGRPYVLRYKSTGDNSKFILVRDLIKGDMQLPENDMDIVVMKGDGLPTYHLAHVVDDYLMGTTHVLRADEWVSSTPLHYQLFESLGWAKPFYGHIAPINKLDEGGSKRKLSKRKDPEANVEYYQQKGYPGPAVLEYLMNLANSDFEPWRRKNPSAPYTNLALTFSKLGQSNGPLFDEVKLTDISKDIISKMTADEVYRAVVDWALTNDKPYHKKLIDSENYWKSVFSIERDGRPRKDISCWSMVADYFCYFDNSTFAKPDLRNVKTILPDDERCAICAALLPQLETILTAEAFMCAIKEIAAKFRLAESIKELKANPSLYKGHLGEVAQVIRYAITGREKSPDLFLIIKILGKKEASRRLAMQAA